MAHSERPPVMKHDTGWWAKDLNNSILEQVGMIRNPILIWKNRFHVPNHQPETNYQIIRCYVPWSANHFGDPPGHGFTPTGRQTPNQIQQAMELITRRLNPYESP